MTTGPPDLSRLRIDRTASTGAPARGGRRGLVIGAILLMIVAAVVGWMRLAPRALEVNVALASAVGGGSSSAAGITANGYVVARTKASVSAKVFGRLAYLGVAEGSAVKNGAVIARLEDADYRAAVDAAQARLDQLVVERDQAGRDLARAQTLHDERVIADAELEDRAARQRSL